EGADGEEGEFEEGSCQQEAGGQEGSGEKEDHHDGEGRQEAVGDSMAAMRKATTAAEKRVASTTGRARRTAKRRVKKVTTSASKGRVRKTSRAPARKGTKSSAASRARKSAARKTAAT